MHQRSARRTFLAAIFLVVIATVMQAMPGWPQAPAPSTEGVVATFVRGFVSVQTAEAASTWCANEGQRCLFSGTADVWYGASSGGITRRFTDGVDCTNGAFGRDPAPGKPKACFYQLVSSGGGGSSSGGSSSSSSGSSGGNSSSSSSSGGSGMMWCANEGQRCLFSGTTDVWYGASRGGVTRRFTNGVDCNNGVFGDPAPGQPKACFYKIVSGGSGGTTSGGSSSSGSAGGSNSGSGGQSSTCDARCQMITQLYHDVLGRGPDSGGLNAYYRSGLDRDGIRMSLCNSVEGHLPGKPRRGCPDNQPNNGGSAGAQQVCGGSIVLRAAYFGPFPADGSYHNALEVNSGGRALKITRIEFNGELVPNADDGVRYDSPLYQAGQIVYYGVSRRWAFLRDWKDASKWKVWHTC